MKKCERSVKKYDGCIMKYGGSMRKQFLKMSGISPKYDKFHVGNMKNIEDNISRSSPCRGFETSKNSELGGI